VADAKDTADGTSLLGDSFVGVAMITAPEMLLEAEFRQGLDMDDTWAVVQIPDRLIADDGIVTSSSQGLHVKAAGQNPRTGEPAFTKTSPGDDDHVKWMVDTQHMSSNSVPGFDVLPGQELHCSMWARGRTFGTDAHPFGEAVADPDTDLRLASFAMNTIDAETGMVFDVWMTNGAIYPYYERLNLSGGATYGAFSSVFPGVKRTPDQRVKVSVAYERSAGVVRWLVDDVEAARVTDIGFPATGATMIIDHGGTPEAAAPRQLNCGMALMTLLDGALTPEGTGLVSAGPPYAYPTTFVGGPTLFGQGAELEVERFEIVAQSQGDH
jgi:hypothetical protein